jgi:hypothetical protein
MYWLDFGNVRVPPHIVNTVAFVSLQLQQSTEVVADIVVVAFGSAPGVPNW